ncbi:histidine kinase [Dactylosporangium sp. AC04546]|uniref:sensor histidine kinase n=1 Tax=Dactylosporangium sp. AC04546 TaxID=2862460 RepID=UPI001EDE59F6|nr:histidine kinase [Dactylosporangium sp. AC04546]WVK88367.1 histidine kinase [Dactylosporangium sp. AC04546]
MRRHGWRGAGRWVPPLLGLLLAAAGVYEAFADALWRDREGPAAAVALAYGLAVALAGLRPLTALLLVAGLYPSSKLLGLPDLGGAGLVAMLVVVGLAAALARSATLAAGATVALVAAFGATTVSEGAPAWDPVFFALVAAAAWGGGTLVRREGARSAELAELAAQLAEERELRTRRAVAAERTRIARELHDAVAHSVSVMVLQVGVARRLYGRPEAEQLLGDVERLGRESVAELHRTVGILRDNDEPDEGDEHAPQPSLRSLDALAERVRGAGCAVTLRVDGDPVPLIPGLELSAYRIVQEALTNVLRHAPGAPADVAVRYRGETLIVEIINAPGGPARPGGGNGQVGMRERVALYGGVLHTGAEPDGGYRVTAAFPIRKRQS